MKIKGRCHTYGNHIDTDVIIPARYLNTFDERELARHCMEDIEPNFIEKIQQGDIIVAGDNFGCGSSREHAPMAIKGAGVSCVIANSFARIFFRNAINIGLPIFESKEAVADIKEGDVVSLEPVSGIITNHTSGNVYSCERFPPFLIHIINQGGLVKAKNR